MYYSSTLVMNLLTMIFAIIAACLGLFSPVFKSGFLHYNFILWFLVALIKFFQCKKYIPYALSDKPVFALNESYIYDIPNKRKYYLKDIKDITKKYYITIWLNDPSSYLPVFHTGIERWWANRRINNGKSPYLINIDVIDANDDDLFAVLNEYKIAAQNQEPDTNN